LEGVVISEFAISDTAASTVILLVAEFTNVFLMAFKATFCLLPLGSGLENITEWSRSTVQEVMGSPSPSAPNL
jgi:hypothetical protein